MPAEQFSNNAATTLTSSLDNAVTSVPILSAATFPSSAQYRIVIDNEIMIVTAGAGTSTWTVTRGAEGTTAAAHNNGASVRHTITAGALAALSQSGGGSTKLTQMATYETYTNPDDVFFTGLATDGLTILVDRTQVGVVVLSVGNTQLYGYPMPTTDGLTDFIAVWDEGDAEDTIVTWESVGAGSGGSGGGGGGGAPSGAAGGDLSGTYPNPDVARLNGVAAASYALLDSPIFIGTPSLPTGATGVTQSAGNNSTRFATTAYADAAGGGGSGAGVYPWTYLVLTNGTTNTVYNNTGISVASGTDLGALFNARVASGQEWRFGTGSFPITTTMLVPDETYSGIKLTGSGGLINMNIQNVNHINGATHFHYTSSTGTILQVLKAQGVFVSDIDFQATHASYTGTVLDFHGDYTTAPHKVTRHCGLERCTIRARKGDTLAPLLNLSTVVDFSATKCLFHGGRISVRGVTDAAGFTASEVTDEVSFYNCRFQYNQNASYPIISNVLKNWTFQGCVFEQGANGSLGVPILIQDVGVPGGNVSFNDCFGSDWTTPDTVNQAMFTYNGTAFAIRNFYIYLPTGQALVKTNDACGGIYVSGLYLHNNPSTPVLLNVASGNTDDVVIHANQVIPTGGTYVSGLTRTPPRIGRAPYKALSADTTLTHQDHGLTFGVSASGGARTITLPAVSCTGFKVTIKKTDSSGNGVTIVRAGSALIDGATSTSLAAQYNTVTLVADGTNWNNVGNGTSGGGGSTAPAGATYTITTDSTTMTAYGSTGSVAGTNTDLGALINSLAANRVSFEFGAGVFPWTTKMTLDAFIGVTLRGQGGRQDENKNVMGGASTTQFKWTPTSGQAFSAAGTQGLTVDGIGFQWSSASYVVGDGTKDGLAFMSIEGVDHSTPTRHAIFRNCYLGAVSSGKLDIGGPVLDVNKTVNIAFRDCLFVGGIMNIRSHHLNSSDDFANVVDFTACRFSRNKAPNLTTAGWPVWYGSGNTWSFRACHFEPSASGPIYVHETQIEPASGHTYEDCWLGDQSGTPASGAAFINFHGSGLKILGGHWDMQDGYSLIKTNAVSHGVIVSGVDLPQINAATNGVIYCPSNGITDLTINGLSAYPTTSPLVGGGQTEPPRTGQIPYKALSAAATLTHSDHDRVFGVDASGGAVTITLPAVGCVGLKLSVKKIDSSANAVTVSRASSATIDGATTVSLAAQYNAVSLISNGTNWMVI